MKIIAHIHSDFPSKFGIPRQSGLVKEVQSTIVFEPEYRNPDAFRGLEGFSHIWILWKFSDLGRKPETWAATVKPPRLGGNKRMGVFATRSPFRPNDIGLSSVKLEKIEFTKECGPVLYVSGADLMDGTAIYDIKPYLSYTDSHPDAINGFAADVLDYSLEVVFPDEWLEMIPKEKQETIIAVLKQDPRPSYHEQNDRVYGVEFAGFDVRFKVCENILTVCEVEKLDGRFCEKK
jgi:tRNA-Thr(GGU) m(6)t(6)A37 methyltransferase TsaA